MSKKEKKDDTFQIEIHGECENHDVVFCDLLVEYRIGDTYYFTATQINPEHKIKAVKREVDKIAPVKKVTIVMDREGFGNFLNVHQNFINELKKTGIVEDESK